MKRTSNRMKTDRETRQIIREALASEYGFCPNVSDIKIIWRNQEATNLEFSVCDCRYKFVSYIAHNFTREDGFECFSVWTGAGYVERIYL